MSRSGDLPGEVAVAPQLPRGEDAAEAAGRLQAHRLRRRCRRGAKRIGGDAACLRAAGKSALRPLRPSNCRRHGHPLLHRRRDDVQPRADRPARRRQLPGADPSRTSRSSSSTTPPATARSPRSRPTTTRGCGSSPTSSNQGINPARHTGTVDARGRVGRRRRQRLGAAARTRWSACGRRSSALPEGVRVVRFRLLWDDGSVTPPSSPPSPIGYEGRIRWAEEEGGNDAGRCIQAGVFETTPYIAERRGAMETLFELDLARAETTLCLDEVLGLEHSDAPNSWLRSVKAAELLPRLRAEAPDMLWMAETTLAAPRRGAARAGGPRQYADLQRIAAMQAFLLGHRREGIRHAVRALRSRPLAPLAWVPCCSGLLGPERGRPRHPGPAAATGAARLGRPPAGDPRAARAAPAAAGSSPASPGRGGTGCRSRSSRPRRRRCSGISRALRPRTIANCTPWTTTTKPPRCSIRATPMPRATITLGIAPIASRRSRWCRRRRRPGRRPAAPAARPAPSAPPAARPAASSGPAPGAQSRRSRGMSSAASTVSEVVTLSATSCSERQIIQGTKK